MVSPTTCIFCGVQTGNCFGETNIRHKDDCPINEKM